MGGSRSIEERQRDAYKQLTDSSSELGGDITYEKEVLGGSYKVYGKTGLPPKERQKRIHDRIKRLEPILTGLGIKELAGVSKFSIDDLLKAGILLEDIPWLNRKVRSATGPEKKVSSSGMIRDREAAARIAKGKAVLVSRVVDDKAAMRTYKAKIFSPKYFNGGWNPPPGKLVNPLFLFGGKKPIKDSQIQKGQQFRVILSPDLRDDTAKIVKFIKKGSKSEPERYDGKCKGEIKSVGWLGTQVILANDQDEDMEVSLNDLREVAYMELLADKPKYEPDEYRSSLKLNLRYVSEIGSGSYGRVIYCRQVDDNNEVLDEFLYPPRAVKLSIDKDEENSERLIFEYGIMTELKKSLKEEYKKFFPEAYSDLYNVRSAQKGIVMEYLRPHIFAQVGKGFKNLHELLTNKSEFELNFNHKQRYCRDLAHGIATMHSVKIWHGDLKPENIVIAHDGSEMGRLKIIDFDSCSYTFKPGEPRGFDINCCRNQPINGTPLYHPPENNSLNLLSLGRKPIELGPSYDWWTYGLIVFEITTGRVAYSIGENGKYDRNKGTLDEGDHKQMNTFFQGKSQMYMDLANESTKNQFVQNLGISLDSRDKALLD